MRRYESFQQDTSVETWFRKNMNMIVYWIAAVVEIFLLYKLWQIYSTQEQPSIFVVASAVILVVLLMLTLAAIGDRSVFQIMANHGQKAAARGTL